MGRKKKFLYKNNYDNSCHKAAFEEIVRVAENEMMNRGITVSLVHLGEPKEQWFESYSFYPKHGYLEYAPRYMRKELK
jgi:hypothetical protein